MYIDSDDTKIPPNDLDAEDAVLGSLLIDPDAFYQVCDFLKPEDFYREKNIWTYRAMWEVDERREGINQITVAHELARNRQLDAAGGAAYLSHLVSSTPTSVHVEHYARIVLRLSQYRGLISATKQIEAIAYEQAPSMDDSLDKAEMILHRLRNGQEDEGILLWEDALPKLDIALQENRRVADEGLQITTSWPSFDKVVTLRSGTVNTFAAHTSFGKTIIVEQIAETAAQKGLNAVIFHYELTDMQMQYRSVCRYMTLDNGHAPFLRELERGMHFDTIAYEYYREFKRSWPGKVTYVNCAGWPVTRLCQKMKHLSRSGLTDLVVVDYLQLIPRHDIGRKGLNEAQIVGEIAKILKRTCQTLPNQPPLILTSQLNRQGEIRDSGEPEDYSNVIVYINNKWRLTQGKCIYTDCTYGRNPEVGCFDRCIELKIDKNTFGDTGQRIRLRHDVKRFKFYEPEK